MVFFIKDVVCFLECLGVGELFQFVAVCCSGF